MQDGRKFTTAELTRELTRVTDGAYEAVQVTALHARRIVAAVSGALGRVTHEVEDLVWDYRDVAGDLRPRRATAFDLPHVSRIDLRRSGK